MREGLKIASGGFDPWRTEHPQIAKGTYKIWVYFDNLFFRTNEFVVE